MKCIRNILICTCVISFQLTFAEDAKIRLVNSISIPPEDTELTFKVERFYTAIINNEYAEASAFIYMNNKHPEK